jgi:hypothetical protein
VDHLQAGLALVLIGLWVQAITSLSGWTIVFQRSARSRGLSANRERLRAEPRIFGD